MSTVGGQDIEPADWTFTFCDSRTGDELAVLPLTKAKYTRQVSGTGTFGGYIHLADDRIRALNPWAATRQRRTDLFIEYGDRCVWGGPVSSRMRQASSQGMDLAGVTYEGWLYRQRLLTDLDVTTNTRDCVTQLVAAAQSLTDVGITVEAGDGGLPRDRHWLAKDVKPILDLIGDLGASSDLGLEWRIDCFRGPDGRFQKVMRIGEPRLGRRYEDSQITFSYPDGDLIDWQMPEDGSGANNVMLLLGSGSGAIQPYDVLFDVDAGYDEIASGFPSWMVDFRNSDTDNMDYIRGRAVSAMRSGFAGELLFTGVKVRAASYLRQTIDPGDDVALDVTHVALEEWPAPVTYLTRLLGEAVTIGDAGKADSVSLTIGGTP